MAGLPIARTNGYTSRPMRSTAIRRHVSMYITIFFLSILWAIASNANDLESTQFCSNLHDCDCVEQAYFAQNLDKATRDVAYEALRTITLTECFDRELVEAKYAGECQQLNDMNKRMSRPGREMPQADCGCAVTKAADEFMAEPPNSFSVRARIGTDAFKECQ